MILLGQNDGGLCGKKTSQLHLVFLSLFALFLNKRCSFAEKADMRFKGFGIRRHAKYGFQEVSQVLHESFLSSVDFYDMQKTTSIEWNIGNLVNKTKMN